MSEISMILEKAAQGDRRAAAELLPLVYDELRKLAAARLAQERPGQTLQATALVHEAYLRLVGPVGPAGQEPGASGQVPAETNLAPGSRPLAPGSYDSRGHFFAAAAEAMRRILVENARRRQSLKRGGRLARVDLTQVDGIQHPMSIDPAADDLLALEEALVKLDREDPQAAALAKLRLFAGLTVDEAARALGISRTTGFRDWTYARAFLQAEVQK
jgi:DNA-directed RNA polymerase specialized sigma24 family protein